MLFVVQYVYLQMNFRSEYYCTSISMLLLAVPNSLMYEYLVHTVGITYRQQKVGVLCSL